jgi:hypothetical protein
MILASMAVSGADLREAASYLKRTARLSDGKEMVISCEDGELCFEIMGTSYAVPASGSWWGACRVGKRTLELLLRAPRDEVTITVMGTGHLHVGDTSVDCLWTPLEGAPIRMPANPGILELLQVAARSTPEELAASGIMELVIKADGERADLVRRAAEMLAPFGDARHVIRDWVERQIRQHPWEGLP